MADIVHAMYGKVLNASGPIDIPMLLVTLAEGSIVAGQLQQRGWNPYAGKAVVDHGAEVQIMPDHLNLVVGGETLIHDPDGDPQAPPTWWDAIRAWEDRVLVVVLPHGFRLDSPDAGSELHALVDAPSTASAFVPIVHL